MIVVGICCWSITGRSINDLSFGFTQRRRQEGQR